MRGAVTGSGRIGGFDVASSRGSVQSAATHVDPPKYRTVISIQPDNRQPSRRSPAAVRSACPPPPSDDLGVINGPAKRVPVDGADPDETESVASWASSSDRTPRMDRRRQNGHARSPSSSASSSASPAASNRLRTPGSYLSPTSPRREAAANATDDQLVDHPFFALFRDAPYEEESQILSGRGTVRGVRHRVKSGIAVFVEKRDASCQKDYRSAERGKVVLYTTGVKAVRDTYDKCLRVKKILQTHMVRYDERDVTSRDNHRQLAERLCSSTVELPQVFADGLHIGGANDIEKLNESGTLRKIFQHFQTAPSTAECTECGGYRYTPCKNCHGSKKSRRNNFTVEFSALRCTSCDDNGLVLCQTCSSDYNSADF